MGKWEAAQVAERHGGRQELGLDPQREGEPDREQVACGKWPGPCWGAGHIAPTSRLWFLD